ncbi:MAG: NAD-dependent epimerase/dehydratase family protein [Devosia sp.]
MSKGKVVILGLNGHIGRALAEAFAAAGWETSGMARTDKHKLPGVRFVRGDSDSVEDMKRAIGDTQIVVNALNLRYDAWDKGRLEGQMARVLEALGSSGKTMLFPGNIYNFSAGDRVVTPELAQRPQTPRGAIRVRVEQMFEAAAARGDIQVVILRAGDFFGPNTSTDWFDQAMFREAKDGKVATMGKAGVGHSWAYLPDLARAFEALASVRSTLGGFERFHFAGNFVTPEQMGAAIGRAVPQKLKIAPFPLILLRLLGLFDPIMRETGKMAYLWRNPMELRDDRLDALLGKGFATPFETAIAATATPFFAVEKNKPVGAERGKLPRV